MVVVGREVGGVNGGVAGIHVVLRVDGLGGRGGEVERHSTVS